MSQSLLVEFPEGSDDFREGIILLDEAVGRFMQCKDNPKASMLELLISMIVRECESHRKDAE